jgi:putative FmdB family regulatory protein
MPIFEFICRACGQQFESIVRGEETPACPACGAADLEKLVSMFAVDSSTSRSLSLNAARRRNARTTKDKAHADYEYERKHRHE